MKKRVIEFLVLLAALAPFYFVWNAHGAGFQMYNVSVVSVHDGDTLTVVRETDEPAKQVKVRLWGIDAPELKQELGPEAKAALEKLVLGKKFVFKDYGADAYSRVVGDLLWPMTCGSVNQEIVFSGWAWWYEEFAPRATELHTAEASAREAKLGVWRRPKPVAPWVFRNPGKYAKKRLSPR